MFPFSLRAYNKILKLAEQLPFEGSENIRSPHIMEPLATDKSKKIRLFKRKII